MFWRLPKQKTVGHVILVKSDLGMEGQIPCRHASAGFNWLQQSCFYLYQLTTDLKFLEGVIICAKTIFL